MITSGEKISDKKNVNTIKGILKGLVVILFGILSVIVIEFLLIPASTSQIFISIMVSINRVAYGLILIGLLVLVNLKIPFSKLIHRVEIESDIEKFKQEESYVLKIGITSIQRQNQKIFIQESKITILLYSIIIASTLIFLIYITEPMVQLILTNLKPNTALYQDPNIGAIFIALLISFGAIFLTFLTLCLALYLLSVNLIISIDPETKQILFKRYYLFPIRIFLKQKSVIILPIENIKTLQITFEPYSSFSMDGVQQREEPFITIKSDSWQGNKKLLKKLSSRAYPHEGRIKLFGFYDVDVLNDIKTFLVDCTV